MGYEKSLPRRGQICKTAVCFAGTKRTYITKRSRGTANAWHFHHALVFVVTVLCGNLVVALAAP
ncbi:DUF3265 domain-containing protein [Vibrio metschnikovii]|nr:DUF3265 domain-containing protein [Vibrio metschnikovii]EKO3594258.1 DUF3265 domain-containing protein [Vibrio metschnikovii]EKO3643283.1 DUF3265 domain-containing protein [Vibrio metschnikovii]EKO3667609.1 DUF3265 domain-containing protein [Vibrio metschnikovii]EKO3719106.1 DUF3265 domain-containing protein [Vibrio metschnikovii]